MSKKINFIFTQIQTIIMILVGTSFLIWKAIKFDNNLLDIDLLSIGIVMITISILLFIKNIIIVENKKQSILVLNLKKLEFKNFKTLWINLVISIVLVGMLIGFFINNIFGPGYLINFMLLQSIFWMITNIKEDNLNKKFLKIFSIITVFIISVLIVVSFVLIFVFQKSETTELLWIIATVVGIILLIINLPIMIFNINQNKHSDKVKKIIIILTFITLVFLLTLMVIVFPTYIPLFYWDSLSTPVAYCGWIMLVVTCISSILLFITKFNIHNW